MVSAASTLDMGASKPGQLVGLLGESVRRPGDTGAAGALGGSLLYRRGRGIGESPRVTQWISRRTSSDSPDSRGPNSVVIIGNANRTSVSWWLRR